MLAILSQTPTATQIDKLWKILKSSSLSNTNFTWSYYVESLIFGKAKYQPRTCP